MSVRPRLSEIASGDHTYFLLWYHSSHPPNSLADMSSTFLCGFAFRDSLSSHLCFNSIYNVFLVFASLWFWLIIMNLSLSMLKQVWCHSTKFETSNIVLAWVAQLVHPMPPSFMFQQNNRMKIFNHAAQHSLKFQTIV